MFKMNVKDIAQYHMRAYRDCQPNVCHKKIAFHCCIKTIEKFVILLAQLNTIILLKDCFRNRNFTAYWIKCLCKNFIEVCKNKISLLGDYNKVNKLYFVLQQFQFQTESQHVQVEHKHFATTSR